MSGEGKFTTTEEDLISGNLLHAQEVWNRRALLKGWILGTVALALLGIAIGEAIDWRLLWAPIAAAAYMIVGFFVSRLIFSSAARRSFRQAQPFFRPNTFKWDDSSVEFASDRGKVRDSWKSFYAWAADERSIILYQTAGSFITIPTRDLGQDEKSEIELTVSRAGVPRRSSR
jgi:hypothetical protein